MAKWQMISAGIAFGGLLGGLALVGVAHAQPLPADPQAPGAQFLFQPSELVKPYATKGVANVSQTIPRPANAKLRVPKGFAVNLFAQSLSGPRNLLVLPNGDVLAAQSHAGEITLLRDENGDGQADRVVTFASGFKRPFGLALHGGAIYVGDVLGIWKLAYKPGAVQAGMRTRVTAKGVLGRWDDHWTRNIAFGPKGRLFLAEGSTENVGIDPAPHAAISIVNEDGMLTPFATGLRNPVGLHFYPGTGELYTAVNERDMLGNHLVPDYFTRVRHGEFFGWPYAYIGDHPDPKFGAKRPDLVKKTVTPDVLLQSHSAPLGFVFYTGKQFPAEYRGDAFVALHGSWNAKTPTGYKIVRIKFAGKRPEAGYENFATGWWQGGTNPARVIGRPTALAVARDGSLLVADDAGKAIWRVHYVGKK
jgi:glucose/arabinose dehydrogenase